MRRLTLSAIRQCATWCGARWFVGARCTCGWHEPIEEE
jgi:hypothetical protein